MKLILFIWSLFSAVPSFARDLERKLEPQKLVFNRSAKDEALNRIAVEQKAPTWIVADFSFVAPSAKLSFESGEFESKPPCDNSAPLPEGAENFFEVSILDAAGQSLASDACKLWTACKPVQVSLSPGQNYTLRVRLLNFMSCDYVTATFAAIPLSE